MMPADTAGSETEMSTSELAPFSALVGDEVAELIFELAPRKVASRVSKALDHYIKARRLIDVDEEMGAIRCIAAEEELVIAIFEWLKLNADTMPEHSDFIRKYKNHYVKLAFQPVLSQFRFILGDMLENGISPAGLERHAHWHVDVVRTGNQVKLRLADEDGKELIQVNPLAVAVSLDRKSEPEVVDSMLQRMRRHIQDQRKMSIRQFVVARADFRNKLLYAEDAGFFAMAERLQWLIEHVFAPSYRDLLWCLALLLSDAPAKKDFGLVSQFIGLYRRVLTEAKLI
jgi:hypothetical protein